MIEIFKISLRLLVICIVAWINISYLPTCHLTKSVNSMLPLHTISTVIRLHNEHLLDLTHPSFTNRLVSCPSFPVRLIKSFMLRHKCTDENLPSIFLLLQFNLSSDSPTNNILNFWHCHNKQYNHNTHSRATAGAMIPWHRCICGILYWLHRSPISDGIWIIRPSGDQDAVGIKLPNWLTTFLTPLLSNHLIPVATRLWWTLLTISKT